MKQHRDVLLGDNDESLLSQERGLKLYAANDGKVSDRSLLSQERGLKQQVYLRQNRETDVAPFTGAWIETHPATSQAWP